MKISFPLTHVLGASQLANFFPSLASQHAARRDVSQAPLHEIAEPSISSIPLRLSKTGGFHGLRCFVGTPPQLIISILHLGTSALTIPSINGYVQPGAPGRNRYDSRESSTFTPNGTSISTPLYGQNVTGILSQDDFQIGDLLIKDMLFEEVLEWHGNDDFNFYDTVFSLGPYNASNPQNFMSPVARLIEDKVLDRNIFSLRLSRGVTDIPGQLVLGGTINPKFYEGEFQTIQTSHLPIKLPSSNNNQFTELLRGDKWKLPISSISISISTSTPFNFTLPANSIAVLDTAWPMIILPQRVADEIVRIGDGATWGPFAWFDCEKRAEMPNMTFVIGGKEFEITAFDYTWEELSEYEEGMGCTTVFSDGFGDDTELVLLGTSFLKAWVSVWDFDKETVGFARAKHGPPNH